MDSAWRAEARPTVLTQTNLYDLAPWGRLQPADGAVCPHWRDGPTDTVWRAEARPTVLTHVNLYGPAPWGRLQPADGSLLPTLAEWAHGLSLAG